MSILSLKSGKTTVDKTFNFSSYVDNNCLFISSNPLDDITNCNLLSNKEVLN